MTLDVWTLLQRKRVGRGETTEETDRGSGGREKESEIESIVEGVPQRDCEGRDFRLGVSEVDEGGDLRPCLGRSRNTGTPGSYTDRAIPTGHL